ncbi:MAG: lysine--tRNA ligase [SAR324 cluster bacterium]|nr:lysine--tRNA ligase [SAR324 cluster bacterium]
MEDHNEQRRIRREKLAKLREMGIEPYPYRFAFTHRAAELMDQGDALLDSQEQVALAGRLVALRRQGKAAFAHVKDNHARIQIYVRQDVVGEQDFAAFGLFDLGDYVGLRGTMMRTKTGELTLRAASLELLAKATLPLPVPKVEEHDGVKVVHDEVKDVEFRYRQRYADLATNDEVAGVFRKRTLIVQTVREYLLEQGYLEVETPTLQTIYGGAAATPFTTHHKALDIPLYLRIATELYLKRLVGGGFDRVFEIGKDFRNEGIDRSHNPEFTMVEFYQAYADYNDMMEHCEGIWERCALAVHSSTVFTYQGQQIDVKRPWKRITMLDAMRELGGVDFAALDDGAVQALFAERGWELEGDYNRGMAMAHAFEELCERQLIQPTFVIDFPKETTPLCKAHRENPDLVERFEPYVAGYEVGNAYSELNDPQVQKEMFEDQAARRQHGDLEAHPYDADFIRALEYGMPPMGGIGLGIDRLVMMLTDQHSIRDVLLFPTMRPE